MGTGTVDVTLEQAAGSMEQADIFGTRPPSGKPHSISLQPTTARPTSPSAARGIDVLFGVGVGAAAMYYLDPDGGARRRALVREGRSPAGRVVASVIGGALALLAAGRRDALGAAVGLVGSALLARGVANARAHRPVPASEMAHEPIASELGDTI